MTQEMMYTIELSNESMYLFLGYIQIALSLLGYRIASMFPRKPVFRFKVVCVFSLLMIAGVGSFVVPYSSFHMIQHILTLGFALLATILYYREARQCSKCSAAGCRRK